MKRPNIFTCVFLLALLSLSCASNAANYTYDDAGQLLAESYSNGSHVFYEYDAIGNPIKRTVIAANAAPEANLDIITTVSPVPAIAGDPVIFAFEVTNNGADPATEVILTDTFPASVIAKFVSSSQGHGEIVDNALTAILGTLPSGATVTVTVQAVALENGTITNTATVTATNESDVSDNDAVTNTLVNGSADLSITLSNVPNPVISDGAFVAVIIEVTNNGASAANNVVQTLTLPPELAFAFAQSNDGTCSESNGVITCNLGTIAAGATASVTVGMNTTATTGTFSTTGTVVADEFDSDLSNNVAQIDSDIIAATLTVTNTNDNGVGSLRQAILDANANPDADVIAFNIAGGAVPSIQPSSNLPDITAPLMIDGFSAQASAVEIDGTFVANGFTIKSSNVTIRGFVINRSSNTGILVLGTNSSKLTNVTIQGCFIGTNVDGNLASAIGDDGIDIQHTNDSLVGGTESWMGNVISGSADNGLLITFSCSRITVQGNQIGTDVTGTVAIPNADNGLQASGTDHLIGGTEIGAGNLMSGNGDFGLNLGGQGTRVWGNKIGTDITGMNALPNGSSSATASGLFAQGGFSPVVVGGADPAKRNLISGNNNGNVELGRDASLIGNYIGTDVTGLAVLAGSPAEAVGVEARDDATIGGFKKGEGNVISGNTSHGVLLENNNGNNVLIIGNYIGTDSNGLVAIPNGRDGIHSTSEDPGATFIGLDIFGSGNLISGNVESGVTLIGSGGDTVNYSISNNKIGTDITGKDALPNQEAGIELKDVDDILIGGSSFAARNIISGNTREGVLAKKPLDNTVLKNIRIEGNYIGTNLDGNSALGNGREGVDVAIRASEILDNLISGNGSIGTRPGLLVASDDIVVQGNRVGTNAAGTSAIPNANSGIQVVASFELVNVLIGGSGEDEGNLLSGNEFHNISVFEDGVTIAGNTIGPDVTGKRILPGSPSAHGITIGKNRVTILGLPVSGGGNVISGNQQNGIDLIGNGSIIQNNRIGTTANGLAALPNGQSGIEIRTNDAKIGGSSQNEANLISGNTGAGIKIGFTSNNNAIQGNNIGASANGSPLGNDIGIVSDLAAFNVIGGTEVGQGNAIAHSANAGVQIVSGDASVLGNSIHSNGALGIELGSDNTEGVTPNDANDADEGPNGFQNFPLVTVADSTGNVTATLASAANTLYRIEFFASVVCDDSNHGEAERFLGFVEVTTDATGSASASFTVPNGKVIVGSEFVTATATDPNGRTSEFGPCLIVFSDDPVDPNDTDGDGMSNAFELEFFGSETGGDPLADEDADGQSNLAEFLARTDPTNPLSVFEATITHSDNGIFITVSTEIGRTYTLMASSDLVNYTAISEEKIGDGGILIFTDAETSERRFYKIIVGVE